MRIYKEATWEDITPWSGAKFWYNYLTEKDKGDEFLEFLEELYPDGIDETELNDILWFDDEAICDFLGIDYEIWNETGKFVDLYPEDENQIKMEELK